MQLISRKKSFLKRSLSYDTSQCSEQHKSPTGSTDRAPSTPPASTQQLLALKKNVYATLTQSPVLLRHHSHLCDVKSLACKSCRRQQAPHNSSNHLHSTPDIVSSTLNVRPAIDDINDVASSAYDQQQQQYYIDLNQQLISERCNSWKSTFFAGQPRHVTSSSPLTPEMDKSILKVYKPNGCFNVVKCGDATDVKVRFHFPQTVPLYQFMPSHSLEDSTIYI